MITKSFKCRRRPPRRILPPALAALQTQYPGWSIWVSVGDDLYTEHCYATRLQRRLTVEQAAQGLSMTIYADDATRLAAKLADQTARSHA
ncbi:hypothetical protein OIE66_40630 [Nonomuraea sp. NBC_01738]|uniref:hypothetical protein n=1 Tax=Nonomuraea sp. NBC_01738 TaxID=2976003 RepID=UPI002E0EFEA2|nr:hypothetical protein OIE66_40630 [Nonomuraea sp. NBC_01738]